jgi:thiosulfate/3-mercaptopyruvate sulfurtransferase
MSNFVHPEVLVSSDWVLQHLKDPQMRLIEVDVANNAHESGHIPGALSKSSVTADITVVLYGDISSGVTIESALKRLVRARRVDLDLTVGG